MAEKETKKEEEKGPFYVFVKEFGFGGTWRQLLIDSREFAEVWPVNLCEAVAIDEGRKLLDDELRIVGLSASVHGCGQKLA